MSKTVEYPFTADKVRELRLGEVVSLSGRVFTGRDRLHKYLFDGGKCPVDLANGALFHCGPSVLRKDQAWVTMAVGPTTSSRENPYMAKIIEEHKVRVIIGKGGMGKETQQACAKFGCVYLQAVGGAAQVLNRSIARVASVKFRREFGTAEALWEFDVVDLPAIVAIDARGKSLHKKVQAASKRQLNKILRNGCVEKRASKSGRLALEARVMNDPRDN